MSETGKIPKVPKIGIGFRVGSLTVEAETAERKSGYTVWRCRYDCGNMIHLDTRYLQRGTVTDCGCQSKIKSGIKDIRGQRFGQLTALYPTQERRDNGGVVWICRCELCGAERAISSGDLLSGNTKSCGNHSKILVDDGLLDGTSIRKLEYYRSQRFPLTKSGYTGVFLEKRSGKWIAQMRFQGKIILRKAFKHKEDAITERKKAEAEIDRYLEAYYEAHPDWDRNFYTREECAEPL